MKWKLSIFRCGKYTEKEYKTEEDARKAAAKRKTGQIVLCKVGKDWTYYMEVLKGNVKEIHREQGRYWYSTGTWEDGKTLDEIFGIHRRFGEYITTIDEYALNVGLVREINTNIYKTDDGFVKITEYDVTRCLKRITKNEMQEYTFGDFFSETLLTEEQINFFKGQMRTAWELTKFIDWDEWRRYEAACGGDISFDEI